MPAFVTVCGRVKSAMPRTSGEYEYNVLAIEIEPGSPLVCAEVWSKKINVNQYKDRQVVVCGEAWLIDSKAPGVKKTLALQVRQITETEGQGWGTLSVTGRMGNDPEIKYTESRGDALCITTLSLATERRLRKEEVKDPRKKTETSWWKLTAFKRDAENIGNWTKKGSMLGVASANLQWESWDSRETGEKQWRLKATVNAFELMGGKAESQATPAVDEEPAF